MSYNYIRILKLLSDGDIHTYCEYVSRSNATITDTDISPDFSYLSYQDTNVTPLDTDIPATLVHTTADTLCPESTLDDENDNPGKKCFIATAAYGSSIHPYVKTLRDFRDKYLMPHKLGRKLVDLYYRYSPFVANIIAKRNALKIAVQIHLLPLVVFCYSMVHFGPIITGGIALFILVLPVFFMTTLRKERG